MALSTGNKALWSDISAIYTQLNSIRSEHGLGTISIPGNTGVSIQRAHVNNLQSSINSTHSETHLASVAQTSVTLPAVGDPIKAGFISTMSSNVSRMAGICHFNFDEFSFDEFSFGACNRCDGFRDSGGFN